MLENDGTVVGEYEFLNFSSPAEPEKQMGSFGVIGR